MKKIILIGSFCENIELCELCGYEIVGIVSPQKELQKYPYLGTDEWLIQNKEKYKDVPLHIVPDTPFVRKNYLINIRMLGFI